VLSRSSYELDMRNLENATKCPYELCEKRYGNRNGEMRNPDVIYYVKCEQRPHCTQVYLRMEVSYYYSDGSPPRHCNETVAAGCVYSETELIKSIPADDGTTPHIVS
jgi:hypothetical protein